MFTLGVMQQQLEQLERLCSEIPPHPAPLLPTLLSHIRSQVKTRQSQSYRFKEFAKSPNFSNIWKFFFTCDTPSEVAWQDVSGGTIPENHESIIEPLMELSIDHRDTEVL